MSAYYLLIWGMRRKVKVKRIIGNWQIYDPFSQNNQKTTLKDPIDIVKEHDFIFQLYETLNFKKIDAALGSFLSESAT